MAQNLEVSVRQPHEVATALELATLTQAIKLLVLAHLVVMSEIPALNQVHKHLVQQLLEVAMELELDIVIQATKPRELAQVVQM